MTAMSADDDLEALFVTIHRALDRDGYYVDPALASSFTPADLDAITANIAAAPNPTFVVAYPFADNDAFAGSGADLLTRLHQRYGDQGVYLTTTPRLTVTDGGRIDLKARQWNIPGESDGDLADYNLLYAVGYENPATLGAAFARATDLLDATPDEVEQAYDKAYAAYARANDLDDPGSQTGTGSEQGGGSDGSDGGFDPTGLLIALVVIAVLGVLGRSLIRTLGQNLRGAGRSGSRQQTSALPPSALAHIREARDRRLAKQAHDELRALTREIDGVGVDAAIDRVSWQSALDHHAAARQVLQETPRKGDLDVLDAVGSLVLLRRGRSALDAARQRRAWKPSPDCFLDPLHGRAGERRFVDVGGRSVEVPLCAACRAAVAEGERPDILDVERGGDVLPYFETDAEPWVSTGFGSLDLDLITALHGERR